LSNGLVPRLQRLLPMTKHIPFVLALVGAGLAGLAGCSAATSTEPGSLETGDLSGNEDELAVNEVVTAGTVLKVTSTSLNLRSSASSSSAVVDVLSKGDTVTCNKTSGQNGWVSVKAGAKSGWVYGKYVVRSGPDQDGSPTCEPSRAKGAVGDYQKALHDVIAYAEGTRNYSKDGYNVMFSFKLFDNCQVHPDQCLKFGSTCSTAAGRYQFLTNTWSSVKAARSLKSFEPENQERGAAYLIGTMRKVSVPQERAMTAAELSNAMSKLSWEWASLPPGRYGQPNKTQKQIRSMYCSLAGC